ncbi:protein of unknown function [Citrobacter freundii]|nr:protein of unknown function [Citrobacter freundii]
MVMYTQLYTRSLSFEHLRITKYLNQLKGDASIILDSIVSVRDVLTIGKDVCKIHGATV